MAFEQAKRGSLAENFHETTYRASLQLLVVVAKPVAQNGKTFWQRANGKRELYDVTPHYVRKPIL